MDPELEELKKEFLADAEARVGQIENELRSDGAFDPKAVERMLFIAHQLKGAGGSYGFREISQEAAELERLLESGQSGNWSDQESAVRSRIGSLRREVESQQHDLSMTG